VPISILDKPNIISKIDFNNNLLEYYPLNTEGNTEENDLIACTQLKFYLDSLTEYKNISINSKKDLANDLAVRENEII
jgi:hypothetical protein